MSISIEKLFFAAILVLPGTITRALLLGCLIAVHVVPRPVLHGILKSRAVVVASVIWLLLVFMSFHRVQLHHTLKIGGIASGVLISRLVLWLEWESLKSFEEPLSTDDLRCFIADYHPTPAEVVDVLGDRVMKFAQNQEVLQFLRKDCSLQDGRIIPRW